MNEDKVKIELINGCEGKCICINDYRVAGSKPWGGGYVEKTWMANRKDIINALKIYKTVEQECDGCGKHFHIRYCSDGTYEYIGEVCDCLASFHPVNGEPSISEWIEQIK